MKKIIILILLAICTGNVFAQKGDAILGKWLSQRGRAKILVFKKNNKYFGKILWLKTPRDKQGKLLTDQRNLIPSLRKRPVAGLEVLKNCIFNGKIYVDGTVYDPESGRTYTCVLVLKGNNLKVSGYIGMFPGRTDIWTKVNQPD